MPAVIIAAGIGAAATVAGSAINSHAASQASKAATDANALNQKLIQQRFDTISADVQPYINTGTQANKAYASLLGLDPTGDPAAYQGAFKKYLDSTGYQFQYQQGINAIDASAGARGALDSGQTVKAAIDYGQNQGRTYFDHYLSFLSGGAGQGLTAINALSGASQAATSAQVNSNTSTADTVGNAALAKAGSINALLGQVVGAVGYGAGSSSYGSSTPKVGGNWNALQPQVFPSVTSPPIAQGATYGNMPY